MINKKLVALAVLILVVFNYGQDLKINEKEYFETHGFNIIVLNDIYPEGHQGGITFIQHGKRVAANGNLSLDPTPGQWQPYPRLLNKDVRQKENRITATLKFPDSTRIKTAEQPIIYPDLEFEYNLSVVAEGSKFKIIVDFEKPLPEEWIGQVGFVLELYPGDLFGNTFSLGDQSGVFSNYANSPVMKDARDEYEAVPMAEGQTLVVAPEDEYKKITITNKKGKLQLIDGRVKHNNGWFVVRSLIEKGATKSAVEWEILPSIVSSWKHGPVIHTSQVGYHLNQTKKAIIELDKNDSSYHEVKINKITPEGFKTALSIKPTEEKDFLRYKYLSADFTPIKESGMYVVQFGEVTSEPFKISKDIYKRGVWQPTLEYFLPVQMCHMKVFEKYRVWHDHCHIDDALVAPENINHFDVYTHEQIPEGFEPFQHIEGLNKGGWHDAGDYDFRIESQIGTILTLAYAYEEFNLTHDQTLINQEEGVVEIHHPDGKPDVLQQIEHGLLTVLGSYKHLNGNLYRGILCPTLRQYAMLGDASSMTDNVVFKGKPKKEYDGFWYDHIATKYDKYFSPQNSRNTPKEFVKDLDDRFVFFEDNPSREIYGVAGLAAAARVMKNYDELLSKECLEAAEGLWQKHYSNKSKDLEGRKIYALAELFITTQKDIYKKELLSMLPTIKEKAYDVGWALGRVIPLIGDENFKSTLTEEIKNVKKWIDKASNENPFGIPYHPHIWGAGWGIQRFGFKHYFLYDSWPEIFDAEPMLNAMNFILGCHPGESTASFVSNVGTNSQLVAYGVNRADWSYIPGGVVSGTNLVRPDLPELKNWPFLWQQSEYVIGGGATNFMLLVLAADKILNE